MCVDVGGRGDRRVNEMVRGSCSHAINAAAFLGWLLLHMNTCGSEAGKAVASERTADATTCTTGAACSSSVPDTLLQVEALTQQQCCLMSQLLQLLLQTQMVLDLLTGVAVPKPTPAAAKQLPVRHSKY